MVVKMSIFCTFLSAFNFETVLLPSQVNENFTLFCRYDLIADASLHGFCIFYLYLHMCPPGILANYHSTKTSCCVN